MAIKIVGKGEIEQNKLNAELKEIEELGSEVVEIVKSSLDCLVSLDHLHELKEYIEDLIINWEELELEDEEDE